MNFRVLMFVGSNFLKVDTKACRIYSRFIKINSGLQIDQNEAKIIKE